MRHFFLTFLLVLAIIPLKHHFIDTSPRLLKMYDDNLIRIGFWESYNLEKHINYYYKNVDGHRRFKTFFEDHRYDVQFKKLNYFTDTHEGFYNDLVGIAIAYDGLSQDSIARIEPGLPFGTLCLYYEEPEEMPYIPDIPICGILVEFPEPDEPVDIQEEYRKLLEEEGFDFIFERIL